MVKEFSIISELKTIREQKAVLAERERELSSPILYDFELIEDIYKWFKEILSEYSFPPCIDSPTQRKKFIFIILFLYSPSALSGDKMKMGLRDKIAEVTGCTSTLISHNYKNVEFEYHQYRYNRQDIDHLYTEIISRLKDKKII